MGFGPGLCLTSSVEPGRDVNLAHAAGFVAGYPG
jgi:hypothetical protein